MNNPQSAIRNPQLTLRAAALRKALVMEFFARAFQEAEKHGVVVRWRKQHVIEEIKMHHVNLWHQDAA